MIILKMVVPWGLAFGFRIVVFSVWVFTCVLNFGFGLVGFGTLGLDCLGGGTRPSLVAFDSVGAFGVSLGGRIA
jgi:hypothetical protein